MSGGRLPYGDLQTGPRASVRRVQKNTLRTPAQDAADDIKRRRAEAALRVRDTGTGGAGVGRTREKESNQAIKRLQKEAKQARAAARNGDEGALRDMQLWHKQASETQRAARSSSKPKPFDPFSEPKP